MRKNSEAKTLLDLQLKPLHFLFALLLWGGAPSSFSQNNSVGVPGSVLLNAIYAKEQRTPQEIKKAIALGNFDLAKLNQDLAYAKLNYEGKMTGFAATKGDKFSLDKAIEDLQTLLIPGSAGQGVKVPPRPSALVRRNPGGSFFSSRASCDQNGVLLKSARQTR